MRSQDQNGFRSTLRRLQQVQCHWMDPSCCCGTRRLAVFVTACLGGGGVAYAANGGVAGGVEGGRQEVASC